jgi:hypothetical protein
LLQIVVPGVEHVVVRELSIHRDRFAGNDRAQRRQRDLPVQRRIDAAHRREARELLRDHVLLFRPGDHVAVAALIERDGGIDVEAIDRRIFRRLEFFLRELAARRDDRRVEIDGTGILAARSAQP